jgi:hypothetical protein
VLDFLGDVGGLLDLCKLLIGMFITWIAEAKVHNIMSREIYNRPTPGTKRGHVFDEGKPIPA